MLCQRCQQRQANVHIQKNISGVTSEWFLCNECAQEVGELQMVFSPDLSIQNLLSGFLQQGIPESTHVLGAEPRCPECGTTYSQFAQSSLLGCPRCYENMAEQLDPVIRRVQGTNQHTGKVPKRSSGTLKFRREIAQVRTELQQAISKEDYETAARLRDRIRELEQKLDAGGGRNAVE